MKSRSRVLAEVFLPKSVSGELKYDEIRIVFGGLEGRQL